MGQYELSRRHESVLLRAAIVGVFIEAATWLLWLWAIRVSREHAEDTIPMFVFAITQIPSILLLYLLLPLARLIGIPLGTSYIISYAVTLAVQGFLFAVLAYFLLVRPEKKSN